MLSNKNTKALIVAALVLLVAATSAQAASLGTSSLDPNSSAVRSIIHPLAPASITQNTDPNTLAPGTVACGAGGVTTENSYFRLFDLDGAHGLSGVFTAQSVDYGIETAVDNGVPQNLDINVACLDHGLPYLGVFLTPVGGSVNGQPDADLEFFNVPASGSCTSEDSDMSVELSAPLDCTVAGCGQLYVGSNGLGQSAPTYIASVSCSIVDPTDMAAIGFPDVHVVMIVNGDGTDGGGDGGTDGGTDGGDDVVPASNGIGIVLMLALLLGSSAYFMRRRAMN